MRILQVIPYFAPAWAYGGPVRIYYEVCRLLAQRGHCVTVVTSDVQDRRSRLRSVHAVPMMMEGMEVYYLPLTLASLAYQFNLFLTPALKNWLSRRLPAYDVIHLVEYFGFHAILVHHYACHFGVPYVLSSQGAFDQMALRSKAWPKRLYHHVFGRSILGKMSYGIALSEKERQEFIRMGAYPDQVVVIPNGVRLSDFEKLPQRGQFRESHAIRPEERVVLFLGRLHKKKGLDLLMKTFAQLASQKEELRLVLVGPDEGELTSLQRLTQRLRITERVLFTGLLSGGERLSAYVDADIFVLPSRSEGLPMAVLEACAAGLPVVITRQCNVPEIAEYRAGFVVEWNASALVQALQVLLESPDLRQRMGAHGRCMVAERFTWDRVVDRLERVYSEISSGLTNGAI